MEDQINIIKSRPHPAEYVFDIEALNPFLYVALQEDRKHIYFLIKPSQIDKSSFAPLSINYLSCDYKKLSINDDGKELIDYFFVVKLLNDSLKSILFFWLRTFSRELSDSSSSSYIYEKINDYIELFQKSNSKRRSVIGLWGELFFIYNSNNLSYYVDCWSIDVREKLDFSFKSIGVDVKTTTKDKRVHSTKYNQIYRLKSTFITSIYSIEKHDRGISIKDLQEKLSKKLSSKQNSKITDIIIDTLSDKPNFKESLETKYNSSIAKKTIKMFPIEHSDKDIFHVPDYVDQESMSFQIDLSSCKSITQDVFNDKFLK